MQGENTIYEGPNIFASSAEIAENMAKQMGVTVVGELQDIISLYDDLYEIFDKDESITLMADIDKAIGSEDLIDLDVENKDKSINVEVPEDIEIDLSSSSAGKMAP